MYAIVSLFTPPYKNLTYHLPDYFNRFFWQKGLRVIAPVANTLRAGVIAGFEEAPNSALKIRDILWPMEAEPLINGELIDLAHEMGIRHGVEQGACLAMIAQAGLKRPNLKIGWLDDGGKSIIGIPALKKMSFDERGRLARAIQEGKAKFLHAYLDCSDLEICSLQVNAPWPVRPAAKKQIEILDLLQQKGQMSRKQIMNLLGPAARQPLMKLAALGYVKLEYGDSDPQADEILEKPPAGRYPLQGEQREVLKELAEALNAGTPQARLLYGVTGSGKTAVYLELAREALGQGKSALIMAPEVALAHKLYRDAAAYFPQFQPILYHGYQHPAIREKCFREIAKSTKPLLVVGTRSSLFLPMPALGCVIMDEEHDGSYKQDEKIPYHAKEIAWQRMLKNNGLLVLGSATPDMRVFYASQNNAIPLLKMTKRIGGSELPPVELACLEAGAGIGGNPRESGLLSEMSRGALQNCLQKGEQAVILLNRRGYAPLIFCLSCKETIKCPNCQVGMTFHKGSSKLLCHYCDYSMPWPAPCPVCGESSYIPIGEGTEKISEYLEGLTGKNVLRLDRDSARRPGQIDEILTSFAKGESPFLVGTQMLSKGHHFPNVTLVVVADGDIGLNLPDYRAAEKTFQLITQAAGRAGRGEKKGRAIIQTRNQSHYCWQHVLAHDYEGFYESELPLRKKYLYPPFVKLGLLRVSYAIEHENGNAAIKLLGEAVRNLAKRLGIKCLGPAPSPLPMLAGRKRFQCLLKADDWRPMREVWFAVQKNRDFNSLRIQLDLDPMNML